MKKYQNIAYTIDGIQLSGMVVAGLRVINNSSDTEFEMEIFFCHVEISKRCYLALRTYNSIFSKTSDSLLVGRILVLNQLRRCHTILAF